MSVGVKLDLEALSSYILTNSVREHHLLRQLRSETSADEMAHTQVAPEVAQLVALLLLCTGARRVIEVGTYTGYSSLAMAMALPDDGTVLCCDINTDWTDVARRYWRDAGVEHKVDLRIAPAITTLQGLLDTHGAGYFDAAFIDADKLNYVNYYESCLDLVRPGGLVLIDNVLWSGKVADNAIDDEVTEAVRALNNRLYADDRVDISMIPIADGLTIARKR